MARAELLGLQRPADLGTGERSAHLLAAVAVDDLDRGGMQRARSLDHVAEQGPAGERLQHLGPVRVHALTLAGGEDHDRQFHALQSPLRFVRWGRTRF